MALDQWLRNEVWALRVSCLTRVALCDEALGWFRASWVSRAADWGVKVSYTGPACPHDWTPHKNWGYQSLGVPHWATPHTHCNMLVLRELSTVCAIGTGQLDRKLEASAWYLLDSILSAFFLCWFQSVSFHCTKLWVWQHKDLGKSIFSVFEFPEDCSHRERRQSEQPRGVGLKIPKPICKGWGAPAWKINSSFPLNCNSCERKQRFYLEVS